MFSIYLPILYENALHTITILNPLYFYVILTLENKMWICLE